MPGVPAVPPVTVGAVDSPGRTEFSRFLSAGPAGKRAVARPETSPVGAARPRSNTPPVVTQALHRLALAQSRMDAVLRLAASGRSFSPAELLALQAGVATASQVLELAGRVVERSTSALKQVLQTGA